MLYTENFRIVKGEKNSNMKFYKYHLLHLNRRCLKFHRVKIRVPKRITF